MMKIEAQLWAVKRDQVRHCRHLELKETLLKLVLKL